MQDLWFIWLFKQDKQTDREMIEQMQLDLSRVRSELNKLAYRSEDAVMDAAALRTELDRRDREIVSKVNYS